MNRNTSLNFGSFFCCLYPKNKHDKTDQPESNALVNHTQRISSSATTSASNTPPIKSSPNPLLPIASTEKKNEEIQEDSMSISPIELPKSPKLPPALIATQINHNSILTPQSIFTLASDLDIENITDIHEQSTSPLVKHTTITRSQAWDHELIPIDEDLHAKIRKDCARIVSVFPIDDTSDYLYENTQFWESYGIHTTSEVYAYIISVCIARFIELYRYQGRYLPTDISTDMYGHNVQENNLMVLDFRGTIFCDDIHDINDSDFKVLRDWNGEKFIFNVRPNNDSLVVYRKGLMKLFELNSGQWDFAGYTDMSNSEEYYHCVSLELFYNWMYLPSLKMIQNGGSGLHTHHSLKFKFMINNNNGQKSIEEMSKGMPHSAQFYQNIMIVDKQNWLPFEFPTFRMIPVIAKPFHISTVKLGFVTSRHDILRWILADRRNDDYLETIIKTCKRIKASAQIDPISVGIVGRALQ